MADVDEDAANAVQKEAKLTSIRSSHCKISAFLDLHSTQDLMSHQIEIDVNRSKVSFLVQVLVAAKIGSLI